MSSVTIRVDEKTKSEATRIAADFGFDLSSVTRAFYRQIVRENRVPLNLHYPEPNAASIESLEQAADLAKSGGPRFADSNEVFEALDI